MSAYVATKTFRERVLGDDSGAGTTGVDERYAQDYFENIGTEIMGAGKFGLHAFPNDPDWKGWWGDEPPFRCPVFVLTHRPRAPLTMAGGTSFTFIDASLDEVLARAAQVAGGKDVRVGGGPTIVREFLRANLVDYLHVAVAPLLLGRGIRLWDDLRGLENNYSVRSETAESGTVHLTFSR